MAELGGGPRLAHGALAQLVLLPLADLRRKPDLLDRDPAAEELVGALPDGPHAAAADGAVQPVAAADGARLGVRRAHPAPHTPLRWFTHVWAGKSRVPAGR